MKAYVILERGYEFNDCYHEVKDGHWVDSVYLDNAKAEEALLEKNLNWLFNNAWHTPTIILSYFNEDIHRSSLLSDIQEEGLLLSVVSLWTHDEELDKSLEALSLEEKKLLTSICQVRDLFGYEILEVSIE